MEVLITGVSVLCIILGFISLFMQKITTKNQDSSYAEVEVPFLGKMKTNYPALVFVFLGIFLLAFTYKLYIENQAKKLDIENNTKLYAAMTEWTINGKIIGIDPAELSKATISFLPNDYTINPPNKYGKFQIIAKIPKDKRFEDQISNITIEIGEKTAQIIPAVEKNLFDKKDTMSKLLDTSKISRSYSLNYVKDFN